MSFILLIIFSAGFTNILSYEFEDLNISDEEINHLMETKFIDSQSPGLSEAIFTPYFFDSGVGNREKLNINDISVDESFPFGKDVTDWKEITFGGRQYLIGRQKNKVILIQIKIQHFTSEKFNTLYFNETDLSFDGAIGPIVLLEYINYKSATKEGFVLVTESKNENFQDIHWLKISKKGLVKYDTWSNPTRGEIVDLKWFKHDFNEFLIIITRENTDVTFIDISEYRMEDNKLRLMCKDKIKVEYLVSSVSAVVEGEDLFLVLVTPQQQKVYLYRYHLNIKEPGTFEVLNEFFSSGVTVVTSFIQSGRQYFLTNGDKPNIYLLDRNGSFSPQLNYCGPVEEWLVLKVPTFREDVVLLAREGSRVSILTWLGSIQGFDVALQPPCFAIDSHMDQISRVSENASCIAGCSWAGGAVLTLAHVPSLVLACNPQPNSNHAGGLYHFNISLHPVLGPAQDVVDILSRAQQLQNQVRNLSQEFEEEGVLKDIELSRKQLALEESWAKQWDGVDQCLDEVEQQIFQLSLYMDQRRQNSIMVNMTLHQGRLVGSAAGLIGNQPVQTTFKGRIGWRPEGQTFTSDVDVESDVILDEQQHFAVKAKIKMDSIEVTDELSVEELRSQSDDISYGMSPEVQGPLSSNAKQTELPFHHRLANDDF